MFWVTFFTKTISIKYVDELTIIIEKLCDKLSIVTEMFEVINWTTGSEKTILAKLLALTDKPAVK